MLASQDPEAARRALMKLAGGARMSELNPDAFLEQAHDYDAVPDVRDGLLKILQLQGNTHPFAVVRFAELDRWINSGEYERILAGDYPRRDTDSDHDDRRGDPGRGPLLPGVVEPDRGPAGRHVPRRRRGCHAGRGRAVRPLRRRLGGSRRRGCRDSEPAATDGR